MDAVLEIHVYFISSVNNEFERVSDNRIAYATYADKC